MNEPNNTNLKVFLNDMLVEISNPSIDYYVELKTIKKILAFFKKEKTFWEKSECQEGIIKNYVSYYNECVNRIERFSNISESWSQEQLEQDWIAAKSFLESDKIQRGNQVKYFSDSPHGNFLFDLYQIDEAQGTAAYHFLSGQVLSISDKNTLIGTLKTYEFEYKDSDILKRRRQERKSISSIRNEFQQEIQNFHRSFEKSKIDFGDWKDDFIKKFHDWREDNQKKYQDFFDSSKEKAKELEKLYTEKLKLEGPVKYWGERAKKYRNTGTLWVSSLSITIIMMAVVLIVILYNIPEAFHFKLFKGEPEAVKGTIIFASILSFGAYLSKTFSKLTFSSFHLQRDAEEREQLTLVYLALLKEGNIVEEDRSMLLQSIFSRADTGLIGKEGTPTMPGGIDKLINIFGKGGGK